MTDRLTCTCLDPQYGDRRWSRLDLHDDRPDTHCEGWTLLLDLIERAAEDGREVFDPGRELGRERWAQVVTLPPTIAKLRLVKRLVLYGSSLVRLPPEVGKMTALESIDAYTSYRLHWFPFEITRCQRLTESRVSTRALYGNHKYRPPFSRLPQPLVDGNPWRCSVCDGPFGPEGPHQVWVSLRVATDVLPLLVHACSDRCIGLLPAPPDQYVQGPHQGGQGLVQPERDRMYR